MTMNDMSAQNDRRSVSDAELISVIKAHEDPAVKASEVAQEVGLTSTRVNQLLGELEEQEIVESKTFGSGLGWWVVRDPD